MKKYLVSIGLVIVFGLYILFNNQGSYAVNPIGENIGGANSAPSSSGGATLSQNPTPTPTPIPAPIPTPTPAPTPKPTGLYADGTYTGSVADAYYGNLQVAAVIQGGKLTDVQFLQYPSDRSQSQRINSRSSPILRQEAIQAQSANVNIVSGATASSQAFQESLASALTQAKA
jgi:uncharacterized protein with FMN-binding domain